MRAVAVVRGFLPAVVLVAAAQVVAGEPWMSLYDGPGLDTLYGGRPLADGSIVAWGTTDSWGAGGRDAWVVHLTPDGDITSQVAIGTIDDDAVEADADASGGTCLLLGTRTVARVGPDGTLAFAVTLSHDARFVAGMPDGGCALASSGLAGIECWVSRLDATGGLLWSVDLGTAPPRGLGITRSGRLVVGRSRTGESCPWLDLLDADGRLLPSLRDLPCGGRETDFAMHVEPGGLLATFTRVYYSVQATEYTTWVVDPDGDFGWSFFYLGAGDHQGITTVSAFGSRIVLGIGPVAGLDLERTGMGEGGEHLWTRESFPGSIRHDGTFLEIGSARGSGLVAVRGPEGVTDLACMASPPPLAWDSIPSLEPAPWPAEEAPLLPPPFDLRAWPASVLVTPTFAVRLAACECGGDTTDADLDGIPDSCDDCPLARDPAQEESDGDGVADACDTCADVADPAQADGDLDGTGDACDACPLVPEPRQSDRDGDGAGDACDNCRIAPNAAQADSDGDGRGDACEPQEPSALDEDPGAEPLRVARAPGGLALTWQATTGLYSVAQGTLSALLGGSYDHADVACDLTLEEAVIPSPPGDAYLLVVARELDRDSSLGRDSFGRERPRGTPCP